MKTKLRNNNGITLVALVVTIVVLLVLSGVVLSLILGDNGIVKKAQEGLKKSEQKDIQQQLYYCVVTGKATGIQEKQGDSNVFADKDSFEENTDFDTANYTIESYNYISEDNKVEITVKNKADRLYSFEINLTSYEVTIIDD